MVSAILKLPSSGIPNMARWVVAARHHSRGGRRVFVPVRIPLYARVAIPILLLLLIGRLVWRTPGRGDSSHATAGSLNVSPGPATQAWQRDVADALSESIRKAESGNLTAAAVSVDRAESLITAARLQKFEATPEFFLGTNVTLDRILEQYPHERVLFDHVTQARISLAELRSSLSETRNISAEFRGQTAAGQGGARGASEAGQAVAPQPDDARRSVDDSGAVRIAAPRQIAANETLNRRSLGADYLDANLMPETSEVLLRPTTRSFSDGIRVEDITIAGAAQTLDGIHWRNVTFIGTRLRYESGDLDLENVRFVRCRFGFPSDDRGARLASAIALDQSSISFTSPTLAPTRR